MKIMKKLEISSLNNNSLIKAIDDLKVHLSKESIKYRWINFNDMTKKELIYEGKAKTLFSYDDDKIIQYFKDDATAFNKKKHAI